MTIACPPKLRAASEGIGEAPRGQEKHQGGRRGTERAGEALREAVGGFLYNNNVY
jgi:hypothetical protein